MTPVVGHLTKFWARARDVLTITSADQADVVARVLAPLIGTLRPPHEADPAAYTRQLIGLLAAEPPAVLDRLAVLIAAERKRDFPPIADVAAMLAPLRLNHDQDAADATAIAMLGTPDADHTAELDRLRASFRSHAGAAATEALLQHVRIDRPRDSVATLIVATRGQRFALDRAHANVVHVAAEAALGVRLEMVEIVTVEQWLRNGGRP